MAAILYLGIDLPFILHNMPGAYHSLEWEYKCEYLSPSPSAKCEYECRVPSAECEYRMGVLSTPSASAENSECEC